MTRPVLLAALFASLSGCVFVAASGNTERATTREQPLSVRWSRTAAEHDALLEQTYRLAGAYVRAVADTVQGDWAVVLDADETVLDNSLYQRERAAAGLGFTSDSWDAWVRRRAAPALPGAVAFTDLVGALGGRVAIVTNRSDATCGDTRANLAAVGVDADVVLCETTTGDKGPRFQMVETGTGTGQPPLRIAMWVGDNIQDFPGLTQGAWRADAARFGGRYWVLPNPMYGSWSRNPDPTEAP